jgi:hypothetical protein
MCTSIVQRWWINLSLCGSPWAWHLGCVSRPASHWSRLHSIDCTGRKLMSLLSKECSQHSGCRRIPTHRPPQEPTIPRGQYVEQQDNLARHLRSRPIVHSVQCGGIVLFPPKPRSARHLPPNTSITTYFGHNPWPSQVRYDPP